MVGEIIQVSYLIRERHEVEVGIHGARCENEPPRYFVDWRVKPGPVFVGLLAFLDSPPTPEVRYKSFPFQGLYRIVREGARWYLELLEECKDVA
jgi:hypothetical protein